ncbi:MAG: helix-turn-helix domain-containing protein [Oscillospiraceae bacterium]|nr:helix-turn-helix domain-containing protein [Oscillospiraceae bacterium]
MTIADRIKIRRTQLGYSQDELAKKMGYKSRSTINKIELGINDITQSKVSAFAKALDTSVAFLMGWEDQDGITDLRTVAQDLAKEIGATPDEVLLQIDEMPWSNDEMRTPKVKREIKSLIEAKKNHLVDDKKITPLISSEANDIAVRYDKLDTYGKAVIRAVMTEEEKRIKDQSALDLIATKPEPKVIPLYLTPAAAGYASPAFGSDYEEYTLTDEDPQDADFAIKIQGDSMEPYFLDGSIALCNRDPISNGDIGVFFVDGDIFCKQYHKDRSGVIHLFSLNRKRADADIELSPTSNRGFACFGRIIAKKIPPLPL